MPPSVSRPATIVSSGRRGYTAVPNFRTEADPTLDLYARAVGIWISTHTDSYRGSIGRNEIARRVGISAGKATAALGALEDAGIVAVERTANGLPSRITFNVEIWETPPTGHHMTGADRSPHDRSSVSSGHDMTGNRSPRDRIEKQGEEQGLEDHVSASPSAEPTIGQQANSILSAWWDDLQVKPVTPWRAMMKVVENCLKANWSPELIAQALREAPTVSGGAFDLWRNTRDADRNVLTSPLVTRCLDGSVDFFRGRDLLDWRHENVQALRATIAKMHAWGFDFGETMIRIAIAARRPADMVNPTKLAALKNVARFAGWPEGDSLSEAMERAYRNLGWKA